MLLKEKKTCQAGSAAGLYDSAVSSGGAVAVLAGAGHFAACELVGIKNFRLLFGVSGGAICTALRALGRTPKELLHMAVEEDFSSHLSFKGGVFGSVNQVGRWRQAIANLRRLVAMRESDLSSGSESLDDETWSSTGLLGTAGLGRFIQKNADECGLFKQWPENYATMATLKDGSQVVFNADGVFLIDLNQKKTTISEAPAPLPLAVRASAAIPGIMTAIEYKGLLLFDGALSRDGFCPVGVQIRHFGARAENMIACRVGEDATHFIFGPAQRTIRRIWMVHPEYHWGNETAGVVEFRPPIDHLHALKFQLTADEKWLAILIAFESCLRALALRGILKGRSLKKAREIFSQLGQSSGSERSFAWRDYYPAAASEKQLLAARAEEVFTQHGLY